MDHLRRRIISAMGAAGLTAGIPLASAQSGTKLTLAHNLTPGSPKGMGATKFSELVSAKTNGRITINIAPNEQLGNENTNVAAMRTDTLDLGSVGQGAMLSVVPEVASIGLPFLYSSLREAWASLDGPIGQELAKKLETKNLVFLAWWCNGIRQVTNNKRPINTPEDLKGLKIRTMGLDSHKSVVSSMGGQPVAINWAEVYTSLQTGVADGQMNPIPIVKFAKFDEVQKYLTLTNHLFTPYVWIFNKAALDGLSAQEKEVVRSAARSAIVAGRGINRIIEASDRGLPALALKMQVYTPTKAEIGKFRDLAQPAVKAQIVKSYGKEGEALMGEFLAAIDKAAKN